MICLYCHEPIRTRADFITMFQKDAVLCEDCRRRFNQYVTNTTIQEFYNVRQVTSVLEYRAEVKQAMRRYKFLRDAALSEVFAMFVPKKFRLYDVVVPVPISAHRLKERGFNQTSLCLDVLNVKYNDCLVSNRMHRQSEQNRLERTLSDNPFSFKSGFDYTTLKDTNILLVDDIFTTGTTVRQASDILTLSKPQSIEVLTFSISTRV